MGRASAVSTVKADNGILAWVSIIVAGRSRSRAVTAPLYTPGMPCRVWAPHLRKHTEGLERVQSREGLKCSEKPLRELGVFSVEKRRPRGA